MIYDTTLNLLDMFMCDLSGRLACDDIFALKQCLGRMSAQQYPVLVHLTSRWPKYSPFR